MSKAEIAAAAASLEGESGGDILVESITSGANATVLELELNAPTLDLPELQRVLRTNDADLDSACQVLDTLKADLVSSVGADPLAVSIPSGPS